jgi:hypothetical protein
MTFSDQPQVCTAFKRPISPDNAKLLIDYLLMSFGLHAFNWALPSVHDLEEGYEHRWKKDELELIWKYSYHTVDSDDISYNWAATSDIYYRVTLAKLPNETGILLGNDNKTSGFTYYWIFGKKKQADETKKIIKKALIEIGY